MVVCFTCVAGIGSDSSGNMCCFSCCKTRLLPCKLQVKTGFWIGGLEGNEMLLVIDIWYVSLFQRHLTGSAAEDLALNVGAEARAIEGMPDDVSHSDALSCWCMQCIDLWTLVDYSILPWAKNVLIFWMISGSAYMYWYQQFNSTVV